MNTERMRLWYPLQVTSDVTSRIIWSRGTLDPFSVGTFNESLSESLPLITIEMGAHHYDLRGAHLQDTKYVIEARNREKEYFKKWAAQIT